MQLDWRITNVTDPHTTGLQVNARREFVPGELVKVLVGMHQPPFFQGSFWWQPTTHVCLVCKEVTKEHKIHVP